MRIAYFSPLSPVRSGISAYSEALLPHLGRHMDVDVYIDTYQPTHPLITNNFRVRPCGEYAATHAAYDLTVYQVGNYAPYHAYMYPTLLEHPGLVVLHDCVYFHFYRGITLQRGDVEGFREIMRYCYGQAGLRETEKVLADPGDHFRYTLVRRLLDASIGTVVHSTYARRLVSRGASSARVTVIPMGVQTGTADPAAADRLRRRHGLAPDDFVVAAFGMITPHKRVDVALRAFARFKAGHPRARFLLVGESSSEYTISGLIRELGIEANVIVTGRVSDAAYRQYLGVADFCVSLRYPTAGETSLSALMAMEAGRTVAVSNYAQFGDLPDDCVMKVDLGSHEVDLLAAYMLAFASDRSLGRELGRNARAYVHEHHGLPAAAEAYAALIDACVQRRPSHGAPNGLIGEVCSVLTAMGAAAGRDLIEAETNHVLADLGLRRDSGFPAEASSSLKRNMQRCRYYGMRLRRQYASSGFKRTAAFLADKAATRLRRSRRTAHRLRWADGLKCTELFKETCILPDGRVVCSCFDSLAENVLGSVHTHGVYEVFNGPAYQALRYALLTDNAAGICGACPLRNRRIEPGDDVTMAVIRTLQVEITHACNLRCPECFVTLARRPAQSRASMSYETYTGIIDQLKGPLKTIKFYNYGEPFLHKDCMRMLRYTKNADPDIYVTISTNGTLVGADRQRELVDMGIDVMNFSVDGARQASYARYRVGGTLSDVVANMRGLVSCRERHSGRKPLVLWQYILFEWNDSDEEIRLAKRMAVDTGVDALAWVLTHTRGASRRFVAGSEALTALVDRGEFTDARTHFSLWPTAMQTLETTPAST